VTAVKSPPDGNTPEFQRRIGPGRKYRRRWSENHQVGFLFAGNLAELVPGAGATPQVQKMLEMEVWNRKGGRAGTSRNGDLVFPHPHLRLSRTLASLGQLSDELGVLRRCQTLFHDLGQTIQVVIIQGLRVKP
jgi:hypothetical protein